RAWRDSALLALHDALPIWAGCLLRAAEYCGAPDRWTEQAGAAVQAYLTYGYDESSQRYWGRLRVRDGTPILGRCATEHDTEQTLDRKSTRLNSSHVKNSYA